MILCRHLRWKTFAMAGEETADPIALAVSLAKRQVPFSCLRTCQAWGPDDDLVAPEECTPDRGCFAPAPGSGSEPPPETPS